MMDKVKKIIRIQKIAQLLIQVSLIVRMEFVTSIPTTMHAAATNN